MASRPSGYAFARAMIISRALRLIELMIDDAR